MHVFITGANGLVGSRLKTFLVQAGHEITQLVRRPPQDSGERQWDPQAEHLDASTLAGCDALIHLAGENIGEGRWTEKKKQKIRESRVHSTQLLAQTIQKLEQLPRVFVVASAIGYYGDRGDAILTEESPPDDGFLGRVCRDWESAADSCRDRVRVVHVRTGIVLSADGGALAKMVTPFKLGVGGVMGSGDQYWSWITLDDIARLFQFAVENEELTGPVNGVSPLPVTNREFTKVLGKVLGRPTIFPMPAFAARLALGEMADALILASTRVVPEVASQSGFACQHMDLEEAPRSLRL